MPHCKILFLFLKKYLCSFTKIPVSPDFWLCGIPKIFSNLANILKSRSTHNIPSHSFCPYRTRHISATKWSPAWTTFPFVLFAGCCLREPVCKALTEYEGTAIIFWAGIFFPLILFVWLIALTLIDRFESACLHFI